jgi:putative aldouronate transport system permease protein
MTLPGLVFVIIFNYIPMFGVIMAFKKVNFVDGILGSPWNGLDNFKFLFKNQIGMLLRNTLGYNIVFITCGMLLKVSFAVALNELRSKMGKKIYQTIIMLPHFLSMIIISYLVLAFLNTEYGLVNTSILPALGAGDRANPTNWYLTTRIWPGLLIFIELWKGVGYGSIVYFAAIAGIDQEQYEAAVIDGATKFQQIWHITVPNLIPLMIILGILDVGKIFGSDFGLFYWVPQNQSKLLPVTQVITTYVYRTMRSAGANNLGLSAAAGLFQSVMGFILVITTNLIVRKIDPEKSLF